MRTFRLLIVLVLVAACAGDSGPTGVRPRPPGDPALPDLAPLPPVELHTEIDDEGVKRVLFTSTLVNVGEGEFVISAQKLSGEWVVEQDITYPGDDMYRLSTSAELAWGGDGHDHWHVEGVARYRLVGLDETGEPFELVGDRVDHKIGFCFFDNYPHQLELPGAPEEEVYAVAECGTEDSRDLRMGMSIGWGDTYVWTLPGQSIDISDLEDGPYRIWAEADPDGWFEEADEENNVTWVDIDLWTREDGAPIVDLVQAGPVPRG